MTDKLIINRTADINFPFALTLETSKLNNAREFNFCMGNFSWLTPNKHFIIETETYVQPPTSMTPVKPTIIECNFIKEDILLVKLYEYNSGSQIFIATVCEFVDNSDFSFVINQ